MNAGQRWYESMRQSQARRLADELEEKRQELDARDRAEAPLYRSGFLAPLAKSSPRVAGAPRAPLPWEGEVLGPFRAERAAHLLAPGPRAIALSPRERELVELVAGSWEADGAAPAYEDLALVMRSSVGAVSALARRCVERGALRIAGPGLCLTIGMSLQLRRDA